MRTNFNVKKSDFKEFRRIHGNLVYIPSKPLEPNTIKTMLGMKELKVSTYRVRYTEVRRINSNNWGLFCTKTLFPSSFIDEYTGEEVGADEDSKYVLEVKGEQGT